LNLKAAGEGTVVIGGERRRIRPRVAGGDERERLWPKLRDAYPGNEDYVQMMGRDLTVVVLEPL
jgi:deazaflavin-dependent oxidoreductase (nitroreductase family)